MKNKMPNTPMPAPAPTVQTDDATTTTGEDWYAKKKKGKKGLKVLSYLRQLVLKQH